jgi:hypothetical protein
MWAQLGARMLLFPYVQPSLTVGGPPDTSLFLRVLFREEQSKPRGVDPGVLKDHLRRFFGISVAKGLYDPDNVPEVRQQMKDLDARLARGQTVSTLTMPSAQLLAEWKRAADRHDGRATLGTVLGIASIQDAVSLTAAGSSAPGR